MFTVRPESFFFPKKTLVRLYSIIILVTGKDFFFRGDPFFLFVSDERAKGAAFRFGPAVLVDRSSVESAQIECLLFFSLVETCGFFSLLHRLLTLFIIAKPNGQSAILFYQTDCVLLVPKEERKRLNSTANQKGLDMSILCL